MSAGRKSDRAVHTYRVQDVEAVQQIRCQGLEVVKALLDTGCENLHQTPVERVKPTPTTSNDGATVF